MKKAYRFLLILSCIILSFPLTGLAAENDTKLPIDVVVKKIVAYDNQESIQIEKMVIEEKTKDSFKEDQELVFLVKNKPVSQNTEAQFYMTFDQDDTVEISDNKLTAQYKSENGNLIVKVKESNPNEVESITISNITLKQNTDRIAFRTYSLYMVANSDTELVPVVDDFIEVEEYVEPAEKKPLDMTIRIGDNRFIVNGVHKNLRTSAYISDEGYTMLPIREVTEVFPGTKILWDDENKVASILFGPKYVSIKSEANEMYVNGNKYALTNRAEVKDGRMFVSLRDMCHICDIPNDDIQWNSGTRTVTIRTEINS